MNFDSVNVNQYDIDREIPFAIKTQIVDFIAERFPIKQYPLFFEPGIGTGRWAIPFAMKGYNVYGIDISKEMLSKLSEKVSEKENIDLQFELGNVYSINFPNNHFDLCVVSHLFHLIDDLETAINEITRVLKPHKSVLIHIKSGKGNSIPELSKLYIHHLQEYGYSVAPFKNKVESAFDLLEGKGYEQLEITNQNFTWKKEISLSDGISTLENKSYSFTNITNAKTHNSIIESIKRMCIEKYDDIDKKIEVENQIALTFFSPKRYG